MSITKNVLCKTQWHTPVTRVSGGWGRRITGLKASHSYIGGHASCWERGWLVWRRKRGRRRRKEEEEKGVYFITNFFYMCLLTFSFSLFYYLREKQEKCFYSSHTAQHAASWHSYAMSWCQEQWLFACLKFQKGLQYLWSCKLYLSPVCESKWYVSPGKSYIFSILYLLRYPLSQQPFSIFPISIDTTI